MLTPPRSARAASVTVCVAPSANRPRRWSLSGARGTRPCRRSGRSRRPPSRRWRGRSWTRPLVAKTYGRCRGLRHRGVRLLTGGVATARTRALWLAATAGHADCRQRPAAEHAARQPAQAAAQLPEGEPGRGDARVPARHQPGTGCTRHGGSAVPSEEAPRGARGRCGPLTPSAFGRCCRFLPPPPPRSDDRVAAAVLAQRGRRQVGRAHPGPAAGGASAPHDGTATGDAGRLGPVRRVRATANPCNAHRAVADAARPLA